MTASITELQLQYNAFRRKYGRMLRAARREMHTPLQKGLVDVIAATAFNAGFNSPNKPVKPLVLRGWKAGVDRRI